MPEKTWNNLLNLYSQNMCSRSDTEVVYTRKGLGMGTGPVLTQYAEVQGMHASLGAGQEKWSC